MRALRTSINQFFARYDLQWEALMGVLVVVWLLLAAQERSPFSDLVENTITLIFAAEFAVRFAASWDRGDYFKGHWIDLFTLLPVLRGFRILRLLRLLRLIRAARGLSGQLGIIQYLADDPTIRLLAGAWVVVTAVATLLFYIAEIDVNTNVTNLVDAFWWSVVTATTVGYGDIYPVTAAGRAAGMVMMIAGIATFSALAGTMSSSLQRRREETRSSKPVGDSAGSLEVAAAAEDDPVARLRRLEELRREELISAEEYDAKRAEVMAAL